MHHLYRAGAWAAGHLPADAVLPLAGVAGTGAYLFSLGGDRELVARNMRRAGAPGATRRAFVSYARYWLESLRLWSMSEEEIGADFSIDGQEHIEAAQTQGHGAVLAIPHVGGWDVGGAWLVDQGFPLTVVAEVLEPKEMFEWFVNLRRNVGLTVVPLDSRAGTAVVRTLRANGVVALLCDRDIDGRGVEVEFFGERTLLPGGPAALALRESSPLLPTAVYFDGKGHRAVVCPPLEFERQGTLKEDAAALTQLLAYQLERLIRRAPEQWHMFQPNWPSDRVL
ncbi:MAG TPA: phosphatidylinositol mannoside acyltransferase [Acidimicrobiales bacterium]|nr:phosphatidylinositol mannoside acyltransferase [Acidimicrobiales bacterium]